MRVFGRILLAAALVVVVAAALMRSFNERILISNSPKWLRALTYALFRPDDFYVDLAVRRISVTQPEAGVLTFVPKYRGRHKVGIILRGATMDSLRDLPRSFGLRIALSFSSNGKLHMSEEVGHGPQSPFLQWVKENEEEPSSARSRHGYSILFFQVPEDVPIGSAVSIEYRVTEPDERLAAWGPIDLFVRKLWDW